MRADFIEILVIKAYREHLGITYDCLDYFVRHVDDVIGRNKGQLRNRNNFQQAYAALEHFVDRMIASAKSQGATDLHKSDFFNAKAKCGIIFWC